MILDFEHHFSPYELWLKRGGKPGQIVRVFDKDGKEVMPLDDASHDINIHLKTMDAGGIDIAVLTGTAETLEDARLINTRSSEIMRQYPKRFVGFGVTLPLGGKPALDELDRAVTVLGLKGVLISAQVEGRLLDSRELWPFYRKVSQLDIPIFVHVSPAAKGFDACEAPYDLNRTLVREIDLMLATTRLCLGGVLEEFPDLKFIMAHFGGGISSVKERLDRFVGYWKEKFWQGQPLISAPYDLRFNEHFGKLYFNMAGRELGMDTVKCALTNISPRRLLFATDFPANFVGDPAGIKNYIAGIRKLDIDKSSIEDMLGNNGIKLLKLKV